MIIIAKDYNSKSKKPKKTGIVWMNKQRRKNGDNKCVKEKRILTIIKNKKVKTILLA